MDLFTLNVTVALVNLTCGLMCLTIWLNQRQERCLVFWGGGMMIYGALAAWYRYRPADAIEMAVGYSLLEIAVVLIWLGFRAFDGHGSPPKWLLPLPMAPIAACLTVGVLSHNWELANKVTLVVHCMIVIAQATDVVRGRLQRIGPRALAAYSVYAMALSTMAPALLQIWLGDGNTAQNLIPLADLAVTIVFTMSVIAMVGERDFRQLMRVARSDPLTGVLNRAGLSAAVAECLSDSALVLFDLDHFKAINDTYGHDSGDAVLRQFTQRAAASIGGAGLLARMGGEEFLVVSQDASLEQGRRLAEMICSAAKQAPVHVGSNSIPFTVSAGVALRRRNEELFDAVRRADQALYQAKADGRNRVVICEDDCPPVVSLVELKQPRRSR